MKPIRFATWAAVSSDAQAADDKFSLESQSEISHKIGKDKGWVEAAGPYIVPGESRTKWVNLSDAEQAIPQLHQLLDDAQNGLYDVLVCAEYDRFRELLDPVARTLAHYGVQIYSASQPIEPQDPLKFNPYSSDSEPILRSMSQIISRAAISNLRRKYYSEMPKRITEKGLVVNNMPYGYRKPPGRETDPNVIPQQDPALITYVVLMKDMLLTGRSLHQIAAELELQGAPLPKLHLRANGRNKWDPTTVRRIVSNPFYAGWVRWGVSKSKRDLRLGKTIRTAQPDSQIIKSRGAHEPLWDDDTLATINAELERRMPSDRGHITRQFTGLLRCSVCGAVLWRSKRGSHHDKLKRIMVWECHNYRAAHVLLSNDVLLELFATKMEEFINQQQAVTLNEFVESELIDLRKRRARVGDAYEAGAFTLAEFMERTSDLDKSISELEEQKKLGEKSNFSALVRNRVLESLRATLKEVSLIDFLKNFDPQEVNAILHSMIERIVVSPDGQIIEIVPAT